MRRTGALDDVALVDAGVAAEAHDADVVVLEVERHALDAGGELDHLAGLNLFRPYTRAMPSPTERTRPISSMSNAE